MQVGNEALVLSVVGVIGLGCQWLAWRLRLPAILFLLLAGLIVGPFMQWLNPFQNRQNQQGAQPQGRPGINEID